jgi:RNA polymerase sigma-70 factor (ECF subfamily)
LTLAFSGGEDLVARFERVTKPYHERLFRIAVALCGDRDQAADLTQEALVRAFRAFDRFRPDQPVLPWLARILRNYFLDTLKTGRAKHELAGHQMATEDPYANLPARAPSPFDEVERSQLATILQEEIEALDQPHQLVLILCDIEGFSYQEAARVAGVPVGTVRSRLSRCRSHLRQRIQERLAGQQKNERNLPGRGTRGPSRS